MKKLLSQTTIQFQHKTGALPNYILKHKAAKEAEEASSKKAEKLRLTGCPPGHSLLPYDQRLATLESLRLKEAELIRQLNTMPFGDTPSLRRRKDSISAQLADVDAAIEIFSKPKVFVKDDSQQ